MACPAWVLTSIGAPAPELRRVKAHLDRGGAIILHNGVDYLRAIQRGGLQPSTSTNGLVLNVTVHPPMSHLAGRKIGSSGQVYLPRKLNVSTPHVSMPQYMLVDAQLDWLVVIPEEDREHTRSSIDTDALSFTDNSTVNMHPAVVSPENGHVQESESSANVDDTPVDFSSANPIGDRLRNSMLVMGSSFVTAAFQLARNHLGLRTTLFVAGTGLLAATEYSETPIISHGATWISNSTQEWRADVWNRALETWEWTKVLLFGGMISLWMMLMCVLWSHLKRTSTPSPNVATTPTTNVAVPTHDTNNTSEGSATPNAVQPEAVSDMQNRSTFDKGSIPILVHGEPSPLTDVNQTSLSGATSGVESGAEEIIDLETQPACQAEYLLIDGNPRSPFAFVPCYAENAVECVLMAGDGVAGPKMPQESALVENALLCPSHLRAYGDRLKLWKCRNGDCNEKGHHMDLEGVEIVECTDHLKQRLKTISKTQEVAQPEKGG